MDGECRKFRNVLHNLYSSPFIIIMMKSERMKLAGNVRRMDEKTTSYKVLVEMPEAKRPLGRPKSRWEYYHGL
jgi:hypothetical protein